jgi:hypothetical protein
MVNVVVFNKTSGRILRLTLCPEDAAGLQAMAANEDIIIAASQMDINLSYVDIASVAVVPRPEMPCVVNKTTVIADGADFAAISSTPSGAEVFIDGEPVGVGDGSDVEITFDLSGQHVVKLSLFPYLDWEVALDATI